MKKIISALLLFIISANTLFAQPSNRKVKPKKPNNYQSGAHSGSGVEAKPQTQTVVAPGDPSSGLKPKQRKKG
jgi:hypothetical protein